YWIFPTLAAFADWNRGLVLLCLGVVTLWVLVDLQNRALRQARAALALLALMALPTGASAADIQVLLPAELSTTAASVKRENVSVIAFGPALYQVRMEAGHFEIEARLPFTILRAGETPVSLFSAPVHLLREHVEGAETNLAGLVNVTNRLGFFVEHTGAGTLD